MARRRKPKVYDHNGVKVTYHSFTRWCERFPERDLAEEYDRAVFRLTNAERKGVRARCSLDKNKEYCNRDNDQRFMRKTRDGIVFVVDRQDVVITVFQI